MPPSQCTAIGVSNQFFILNFFFHSGTFISTLCRLVASYFFGQRLFSNTLRLQGFRLLLNCVGWGTRDVVAGVEVSFALCSLPDSLGSLLWKYNLAVLLEHTERLFQPFQGFLIFQISQLIFWLVKFLS